MSENHLKILEIDKNVRNWTKKVLNVRKVVEIESGHADFNKLFRILKFRIFSRTFWYTDLGIF